MISSSTHNNRQESLIRHVSGIMAQSDAQWTFLREPEIMAQDAIIGNDVDIWCASESFPKVIATLINHGWRVAGGRCLGKNTGKWRGSVARFFRDDMSPPVLEIFSGDLRSGSVFFIEEEAVRKNIKRINGIPYCSGLTLLSILITRTALRGILEGMRLDRASSAWSEAKAMDRIKWKEKCSEILGRRNVLRIEKAIVQASPVDVPKSICLAGAAWLRGQGNIGRLLMKVAGIWLRRRFRKKSGAVCAIIGTDGSGKSTLARDTVAALNRHGSPAKTKYWGRSRQNAAIVNILRRHAFQVLESLGIKAGRRLDVPAREKEKAEASVWKPPYRIYVSIGAIVYFMEYWWRTFSELAPRVKQGEIVLIDRGPFDLAVMKGAIAATRRLVDLSPRPDALVFCDASPKTIFDRKPERHFAEIENQQTVYRDIFSRFSGKIPAIRVVTVGNHDRNIAKVRELARAAADVRCGNLDRSLLFALAAAITDNSNPSLSTQMADHE